MPELSPAVLSILAVVRTIPRGKVASYAQVAARAGWRGRARLVAWALKHAPAEDPLPWHRVLRADGRIAFAEGSDAHDRQLRLLKREKVTLIHNGRVARTHFAWCEDELDAQLWRIGD